MTETVNARLSTNASASEVLAALAIEFGNTKAKVERGETILKIYNPNYWWLNPPANTTIIVDLIKLDTEWLLTASIDQKYKLIRGIFLPIVGLGAGLYVDKWYLIALSVLSIISDLMHNAKVGTMLKTLVGEQFKLIIDRYSKPTVMPDEAVPMRKCPSCAESVRAEAIRCRYCHVDLIPVIEPSQ